MNSTPPKSKSTGEDNGTRSEREVAVIKTFADILNTRFQNFDELVSTLSSGSDEFKGERRFLSDLNSPAVKWGIISTVVTFAALRGAPALMRSRMASRAHSTGIPPSSSIPRPAGPIRYTLGLGFDSLLSLVTGFNVTAFLTDFKKVRQELVKVPLVEGRSLLSEALCTDFIKEYNKTQSEGFDWSQSHSNMPQIQDISAFVENCKKRQAYEDQLRNEQGLAPNQPVCIPSPGVSPDQSYKEEGYSQWTDMNSFSNNAEKDDRFLSDEMTGEMGNSIEVSNDEQLQKWNSFDDFEDSKEVTRSEKPKKNGLVVASNQCVNL